MVPSFLGPHALSLTVAPLCPILPSASVKRCNQSDDGRTTHNNGRAAVSLGKRTLWQRGPSADTDDKSAARRVVSTSALKLLGRNVDFELNALGLRIKD
jgi:hypothetical protein